MPTEQISIWEIITAIATAIAAIGAVYFGWIQTKINKRIQALQDYVAVSFIPYEDKIKVLNTGKLNVYLYRFVIGERTVGFDKPRMIPANAGDASWYWIPLNGITVGEFQIYLYFKDEFGKKYKADGGGSILKVENDRAEVSVWTNSTRLFEWEI